jgi:hypothetical protein
MDLDEFEIKTYNPDNGEITFTEGGLGYHFGDWDSTEENYGPDRESYGVDMRAEVALMDRNIKIDASLDDIGIVLKQPWGCRVLVSDFFEADRTYRSGSIQFDNVQIYNCSQRYTWKAALKFENAMKGGSVVTNSAITSG